jgi:hypothetical protein
MLSEWKFKQHYLELIAEFESAFPGIKPPAPEWFQLWLGKYSYAAISEAIQTLQKHPMKPRFTTDSCGKALSALLSQIALQRAMACVTAVKS